jgi:hypothetical protein
MPSYLHRKLALEIEQKAGSCARLRVDGTALSLSLTLRHQQRVQHHLPTPRTNVSPTHQHIKCTRIRLAKKLQTKTCMPNMSRRMHSLGWLEPANLKLHSTAP